MTSSAPGREPVGVIGGSGFYSLFDEASTQSPDTPFGPPSGPITTGMLAGRPVAFVPRHGPTHEYPPHLVPYRANLWAFRSLGVRQVVSLSAVGSLRADLRTGTLVVPDQIVDRTWGRPHTIYDEPTGVGHATFADPYCPRGRAAAVADGVVGDGTLVVVNGPRFSTRAESLDFQARGASIIGMTAMPEASLARELGLCYTTLALVTDLDAGVEVGAGVTHTAVLEAFEENLPRLRALLVATLGRMPAQQGDCPCGARSGLPPLTLR